MAIDREGALERIKCDLEQAAGGALPISNKRQPRCYQGITPHDRPTLTHEEEVVDEIFRVVQGHLDAIGYSMHLIAAAKGEEGKDWRKAGRTMITCRGPEDWIMENFERLAASMGKVILP